MKNNLFVLFAIFLSMNVSAQNQLLVRDAEKGEVIIPLVFHVIHGGGMENVTDDQIHEAIKQLNEDYNAQTPGIEDVIPEFKDIVANVGVLFQLARIDPNGKSTSGIIRHYRPDLTTQTNGYDLPMKNEFRWPVGTYFNVYVIRCAGPEAGSAWSHSMYFREAYDGVVTSFWALGRSRSATLTHKKIFTHEVGHWLSLPHPFDGGCEEGDGIDDTPPCEMGHGCNNSDTACDGTLANRQNFMDYTKCQVMFTKGQEEVMLNTLDSSKNGRNKIWQIENQIKTGLIGEAMSAQFYAYQIMTTPGDTILFYDFSEAEKGEIISWEWKFSGGQPAFFSGKTPPPIVYAQKGVFDVRLTTTNSLGDIDEEFKESYINVSNEIYMQTADFSLSEATFYDPGYLGKYGARTDAELTLRPKTDKHSLQVVFNMFKLENTKNTDYLRIYDGPNTSATLIGEFYGRKSPGAITSTHPSGALTFVFHSNVEFKFDGWEAIVSEVSEISLPVANFSTNIIYTSKDTSIQFTNLSKGMIDEYAWQFEGGNPKKSTEKSPSIAYSKAGKMDVKLSIKNKMGENTIYYNDYIYVKTGIPIPYKQGFEGSFPPQDWIINNPDAGIKWQKSIQSGYLSSSSMAMNNADNDSIGEIDEIILHALDLSETTKPSLVFNLAYTQFDSISEDALSIHISTDNGLNWKEVYKKNHLEMETTKIPTDDSNAWIPKEKQDWRTEKIDLSEFANQSNVLIKFQNTSGFGTRIWVDNIAVMP